MSTLKGLPDGGKIVILSPLLAALAVEQHPEYSGRFWTSPLLDSSRALVVDLDKLFNVPGGVGWDW